MTDGLRPGVTAPLRLYLVPDTALHFIKAQTEQRLAAVEVQQMIEAIESRRLMAKFRNHVKYVKAVVAKNGWCFVVAVAKLSNDCNNEARNLVTVRHANADRCFTDHEKKHNNQAKGLFMNVMLFPSYVLVVLLVYGNTVFAD